MGLGARAPVGLGVRLSGEKAGRVGEHFCGCKPEVRNSVW